MAPLRYLLFFPSVTFNVFAAEVFPWATLYAAVRLRYFRPATALLFLLLLCSGMAAIMFEGGRVLGELVRTLAAYANPLLLFVVVLRVSEDEVIALQRTLRTAFWFMIALGLSQAVGVATVLQPVLGVLVGRASGESIDAVRGVTLLASEPSRAAMELIFVYAAMRIRSGLGRLSLALFDVAFAGFVVFLLKSFAGLAYLGVFFFFVYPMATIVALVLAIAFASQFVDNRIFYVLAQLADQNALGDVILLLFDQSGFRGISVIAAYVHGFLHPLGSGVGNWEQASVQAMGALGIAPSEISFFAQRTGDFFAVRPTSYAANVALDTGLLGLCALFAAIISDMPRNALRDSGVRVILAMWLVYVFVLGSVGDPVPWLCLGLACRVAARKHARRPMSRDDDAQRAAMPLGAPA